MWIVRWVGATKSNKTRTSHKRWVHAPRVTFKIVLSSFISSHKTAIWRHIKWTGEKGCRFHVNKNWLHKSPSVLRLVLGAALMLDPCRPQPNTVFLLSGRRHWYNYHSSGRDTVVSHHNKTLRRTCLHFLIFLLNHALVFFFSNECIRCVFSSDSSDSLLRINHIWTLLLNKLYACPSNTILSILSSYISDFIL